MYFLVEGGKTIKCRKNTPRSHVRYDFFSYLVIFTKIWKFLKFVTFQKYLEFQEFRISRSLKQYWVSIKKTKSSKIASENKKLQTFDEVNRKLTISHSRLGISNWFELKKIECEKGILEFLKIENLSKLSHFQRTWILQKLSFRNILKFRKTFLNWTQILKIFTFPKAPRIAKTKNYR
jgi:hypothetical protein